jgi:ABC-type Na+ efflux pump permease subunit
LTPTGAELVKKEQKKVDKEIKKQEDKKEEEKKKEDAGKIDAAIVVNNNYNKCLRTQ